MDRLRAALVQSWKEIHSRPHVMAARSRKYFCSVSSRAPPHLRRICVLFVRLSSPDNGRLQLGLVMPVKTQVGTQIGGSQDVRTGLWLRNLPATGSDWSKGSRVRLRPEASRGFLWSPGDTSWTVWHLGFSSGSGISWSFSDLGQTRSISRFGSREPSGDSGLAPRYVSGFSPGVGPPAWVHWHRLLDKCSDTLVGNPTGGTFVQLVPSTVQVETWHLGAQGRLVVLFMTLGTDLYSRRRSRVSSNMDSWFWIISRDGTGENPRKLPLEMLQVSKRARLSLWLCSSLSAGFSFVDVYHTPASLKRRCVFCSNWLGTVLLYLPKLRLSTVNKCRTCCL